MLRGETVTSYVLSTVLEDALAVIKEHQVTELTLGDWDRFNALLTSENPPNVELTAALKHHKKQVLSSDGV